MYEELIKQIRSIKMRLTIGVITTRNETDHLLMNQLDDMEEILNKNFALPLVIGSVYLTENQIAELANIGSQHLYLGEMDQGRLSYSGVLEILKRYEELRETDR